ncbi:replicative DNA helicase [Streptomyces abikoensis]|uniref:replicative DNA helicase n=1 Tax=Streptomyces abikoensis TaxID=97398 RepID=UPI0033DE858C
MTTIADESADHHDLHETIRSGFDRVPPYDVAAEQAVLGSLPLSKDAIADVLEMGLKGTDFYRPAHEAIYETVMAMYAKGEPADPITLADELTKRGEITRVGGAAYLHTLVQSVPTAANAAHYAGIVQDKATLRRLIAAGTRIVQSGYDAEGDVEQIVDAAGAEISDVAQAREDDQGLDIGEDFADMVDELVDLGTNGRALGIPTGLTDLDALTFGLHPGQMIIIAARPAIGKTTLAIDIARAATIRQGHRTAFFSLEMGRRELQHRIMSAEAKIALHHIRSGQLSDTDWERFAAAQPRVTAAPLRLDCDPVQSVMQMKAKARRMQQRGGLDLVIIDYLQLVQPSSGRRAENRQQEVSDMSRQLKLMAKELDIPVVVLAQLNRGPEQRSDKRPLLSDLRESGSLEQDADLVLLLHREDAYDKESPRAGEADVLVAKHRNGPTATITVASQLHYSRFVDMARQ